MTYRVEVVRVLKQPVGPDVQRVVRQSPPYSSPATAEYVAKVTADQLHGDRSLAVRIVSNGRVSHAWAPR